VTCIAFAQVHIYIFIAGNRTHNIGVVSMHCCLSYKILVKHVGLKGEFILKEQFTLKWKLAHDLLTLKPSEVYLTFFFQTNTIRVWQENISILVKAWILNINIFLTQTHCFASHRSECTFLNFNLLVTILCHYETWKSQDIF